MWSTYGSGAASSRRGSHAARAPRANRSPDAAASERLGAQVAIGQYVLSDELRQDTLSYVRIGGPATKHGVTESDMVHAMSNAMRRVSMDEGFTMLIGPGTDGAPGDWHPQF